MEKKSLNILWLDDQRDPSTYFKKKDTKGFGTLHDNLEFYNRLFKQYDVNFTWVKNFKEFTEYITKNGVPEFVSFDHDLSKTSAMDDPKGLDCAKWLVNYCNENGISVPKNYVHSANKKWRGDIRNILANKNIQEGVIKLTESDIIELVKETVYRLTEDVYANTKFLNKDKGTINLTYQKSGPKNVGNFTSSDMLKTDKMDADNEDTYIVPLKCGLPSYNITSINGTAVMHYFKNKFEEKGASKTTIKKGKETWELSMDDSEWGEFMRTFNRKINRVVNYCAKNFKKQNEEFEVRGVSIYPVPSSSKFNECTANDISKLSIIGLPSQVINTVLLKKNLQNLERDEEFIEKNKKFFNSPFSSTDSNSVLTHVDNNINKLNAFKNIGDKVENINNAKIALDRKLEAYHKCDGDNEIFIPKIAEAYASYYDAYQECLKATSYENLLRGGKQSKLSMKTIATEVSGTNDNGETWKLVEPILKGKISKITERPYKSVVVSEWETNSFQIKKLSNGERMGLKGIFVPNEDAEKVQKELEKIKGTIFVIFDDNISGGATLSDICYECKNMGIKYIVPITFGKMATKWQINGVPLSRPTNDKNEEGFNF